jgi:hypothetical protein
MAYITQTDLENYFGATNVARWSNVESTDAGANTTKITSSITEGEEYVEDRFREGTYAVPFVATGSSLPSVLKRWMLIFAGAFLYEARGMQDEGTDDADQEQNKISRLKTRADQEMDGYLSGSRRFALQKASTINVTTPNIAR